MRKRMQRGFSSFAITAGLSAGLLILAVVWTTSQKFAPAPQEIVKQTAYDSAVMSDLVVSDSATPEATSTQTGLSPLGDAVLNRVLTAYSTLSQNGESAQKMATTAAESLIKDLQPIVQTKIFGALDVKTVPDTSLERMLEYRSDLRESLAPLLTIPEPEYATFGHYVESHNPSYLALLHQDADIYRSAASATVRVLVPVDALSYHLGILNAMQQFAANLDALATHATDPFASAALLRSYNSGEGDMLTSFNTLAQFFRSKAVASATSTRS